MRSTESDTRIGESYITSLQACKHKLFAKLLNFRMAGNGTEFLEIQVSLAAASSRRKRSNRIPRSTPSVSYWPAYGSPLERAMYQFEGEKSSLK